MENRWLNVVAISSLAVSIVAISISGYAVFDTHQNYKRMVKPLLTFTTDVDGLRPDVGLSVRNAGLGPAIFEDVKIYVDRKPLRSWEQV